ncbi:MAG: dienelactone hydrolase family protein [Rhodospirillales bacterium]|nr:dienelactone hydrolase family protein [Rhodospirillales bacterium]
MRRFLFALALLLSPVLASAQSTQPIDLASATYENYGLLARGQAKGPVTIKATLELPAGEGPFGAVVVSHSCGGWIDSGKSEKTILDAFLKAGWATLIYDSFVVRDWRNVCAGAAGAAGGPSMIADAYAALAALAQHPKIRPDRIVNAGASMGGMTAHDTAFDLYRQRLAPQARFAAHIAYYPAVGTGFARPDAYSGAPILMLLGGADDWTPAARTLRFLDLQKRYAGQVPEIAVITYPDAQHAWLNLGMAGRVRNNAGRNAQACPLTFLTGGPDMLLVLADGSERRAQSRDAIMSHFGSCWTYGVTMEASDDVTRQSLADSFAFLERVLGK